MKPESSVNVSARAPPAFVRAGAAGNPAATAGSRLHSLAARHRGGTPPRLSNQAYGTQALRVDLGIFPGRPVFVSASPTHPQPTISKEVQKEWKS